MKKSFVFFVIVMLAFALNAKTEVPIQEKSHIQDFDPNNNSHYSGSFSREVWDLQFSYDITPSGLVGIAGAETDGTYLYGTKWDAPQIVKFDLQGNFIETFTIPGVTGLRDLAYDGTYFYGSNASAYIWEMDFDAHTLISTINTPNSIRSIAYDSDLDGFWYNNFETDLEFVDRTGALLNTIATPPSMYGSAYDNYTIGGPYLWIFSGTAVGLGCQIEQYDLNTLTLTGETHSVDGDLGVDAYYAGGLFLESDMIAGKITLGGIAQGTPELIFGYDIGDSVPLDAPGAPTDVAVIPDAGGALEAEIAWTCPTTTAGGAALTDLDEMRIYRDSALIYTDFAPVIGGTGSYSDTDIPAFGTYAFSVVGFNDTSEGISVAIFTWVGEDVPNMVTDLVLEQTSPGALSGTLTWVNPTTGLHGSAFNNAVVGYHIVRSDGVPPFEVAGLATEFVDITIPAAGVYSYTVQPYNIVGDGGSATSNLCLIADAGLLIIEDFSNGVPPADWYVDGMGLTNWGSSATANAGGTAPEMIFNWSPQFVGMSRLCTMTLDTSGMTEMAVEFKHNVNHYDDGYTLGCATSSDGVTWNDVWSVVPTGAIGPETINVDITTPDVGSATFQMCFYLDGDSYSINFWYIDDVMLTGAGMPTLDPPTNLAVVSNPDEDFATFTWEAPATGDPTGYDIFLDNLTVSVGNTSAIEWIFTDLVYEQTYTAGVAAVYDEGTSIIATIDFTYDGTGTDNTLPLATNLGDNYPNPFNPTTNIAFSVDEATHVTLEIYNVKGEKVITLVDDELPADCHNVIWNGKNNSNKSVSSGIYFYKMKAGNYQETKKMILMK